MFGCQSAADGRAPTNKSRDFGEVSTARDRTVLTSDNKNREERATERDRALATTNPQACALNTSIYGQAGVPKPTSGRVFG